MFQRLVVTILMADTPRRFGSPLPSVHLRKTLLDASHLSINLNLFKLPAANSSKYMGRHHVSYARPRDFRKPFGLEDASHPSLKATR